jgi:cytochrome c
MASSLETNKVLAAVLTAGIIASGAGVISRIIYHPSMPEENAYVIAVTEGEAEGGEAAPKEAATPLPVLLAAASPEAGQSEAKKCAACHSFEEGAGAKIGPDLYGVVGRPIASAEGFSYSDALKEKQGDWSYDNLNAFLTDPKKWAPGTKMAFAGIKDPEDRADVLAYLRSLAASPVPLPEPATAEAATPEGAEESTGAEAPATAAAEASTEEQSADKPAEANQQVAATEPSEPEQAVSGAESAGGDTGIGALLAQADVDAGAKDARKCAACHSFEEGGPAKIGPPLWNVVGRDIASVDGFSYSDALQGKDGSWDYQHLDAFLAQPREYAPGTKMAFAGIKKPEDRADVILYLRSLSNDPAPLP